MMNRLVFNMIYVNSILKPTFILQIVLILFNLSIGFQFLHQNPEKFQKCLTTSRISILSLSKFLKIFRLFCKNRFLWKNPIGNRSNRFFLLFFFLLTSTLQASVTDIRISNGENQRIVVDSDKKIDFKVFTLRDPSRLVLDLKNTTSDIKAPSFSSDKVVDNVRIGKISDDDTRLVFDLNTTVNILNSFYIEPNSTNKNHRIVIDLDYSEDELHREDLIGKLIAQNEYYSQNEETLNNLIDKVLSDESFEKPKPTAIEMQKPVTKSQTAYNFKGKTTKLPTKKAATKNKLPAYEITRKPRIIIDPGHGGKDPGAIGTRSTKEKVLALTYAKSIKEELERTGKYRVYLTRENDTFIELRDRLNIARRYQGDLFISIHADSTTNRKASGLSIYTLSQVASDTRTASLAKKENKADIIAGANLYGQYQDTISTLVDISRIKTMNESKKFASLLDSEFNRRNMNCLGDKAHKFGNFYVLTSPDMPSLLLEIGFLSNPSDEKLIRSLGHKNKVTASVVSAINRYF